MIYTYESFISYCDRYDVCNEGFIDRIKDAGSMIAQGIHKAIKFIIEKLNSIKNFFIRIFNFFRNKKKSEAPKELTEKVKKITLDEKTSKLIDNAVQISKETEKMIKSINLAETKNKYTIDKSKADSYNKTIDYTKYRDDHIDDLSKFVSGKDKYSPWTDTESYIIEMDDKIKAIKTSNEYKVIMSGESKTDNMIEVSYNDICKEINDTKNQIDQMVGSLKNIETCKNISKEVNDYVQKNISYISKTIQLLQLKLQVLVKYAKECKETSELSTIKEKLFNKVSSGGKSKYMRVGKTEKELDNIRNNIYLPMKKSTNFNEYIKLYNQFCKELGVHEKIVFSEIGFDYGNKMITFRAYYHNPTKIKMLSSVKLFHITKEANIKELKPTFKSDRDRRFYPDNRVYASLYPIDIMGRMLKDKEDSHVYAITVPIDYVYKDPEYVGIPAVFIKTSHSIPVKEINFNEWKAQHKDFLEKGR